jgi:hypothetical protein
VMDAQDRAMAGAGDNARFTREVGRPVVLGLKAFGEGDYAGCIAAIQPVIPIASRFGGSHAQRDLLDLTVMEAALRLPDAALARALSAERRAIKPDSPHARSMFDRARALPGGCWETFSLTSCTVHAHARQFCMSPTAEGATPS